MCCAPLALRRLGLLALASLAIASTSAVAADEPLVDAKALYAAASFEDALSALERVDARASSAPDVMTYRALCLLALGRSTEAESTTETLVSTAPTYTPSDADLSPRFLALLQDVRHKLLPTIAKDVFNEARAAFLAKQNTAALAKLSLVLTLANDSVWKDTPEATDLRTLASGFADLARAQLAALEQKAPPVEAPAAAPPTTVFEPPVVISQPLPKWVAPDMQSAHREYHGQLRVLIGTDGHVRNASIDAPSHPAYDEQLLVVAKSWLYKPALRNGEPVEAEKLVVVNLKGN